MDILSILPLRCSFDYRYNFICYKMLPFLQLHCCVRLTIFFFPISFILHSFFNQLYVRTITPVGVILFLLFLSSIEYYYLTSKVCLYMFLFIILFIISFYYILKIRMKYPNMKKSIMI